MEKLTFASLRLRSNQMQGIGPTKAPPIDHAFDPELVPTADGDPSEADTCDLAFCAHGEEEEFIPSLDGNGVTVSPQAARSTARAMILRGIQQRLEAAERLRAIPEGDLEAVRKHRMTMLWHQGCDIDDLTSRSIVTDSNVWN
ncbi:hypothetical protein LTR17_002885 [Elasticomyces elasticus]|nr:hypothetical protein LTR17_002885 [Elasticomyces elasticus]